MPSSQTLPVETARLEKNEVRLFRKPDFSLDENLHMSLSSRREKSG